MTLVNPNYDAWSPAALRRRIAKLERALEPFAAEADTWADSVGDGYHPGIAEPKSKFIYAKAEFSVGVCRRARRVLNEIGRATVNRQIARAS